MKPFKVLKNVPQQIQNHLSSDFFLFVVNEKQTGPDI